MINIEGYELTVTEISFSSPAEVAEDLLDDGTPFVCMIGAQPLELRLRVVGDPYDLVQFAEAVRLAQQEKTTMTVSGFPISDWDGEYYVDLSGTYSAQPTSLDLTLKAE